MVLCYYLEVDQNHGARNIPVVQEHISMAPPSKFLNITFCFAHFRGFWSFIAANCAASESCLIGVPALLVLTSLLAAFPRNMFSNSSQCIATIRSYCTIICVKSGGINNVTKFSRR